MHKLLHLTVLALLMFLFFSAPAINVDWTPIGPNDTLYQPDFSASGRGVVGSSDRNERPASDSIALMASGLVMLISASFLRRLAG